MTAPSGTSGAPHDGAAPTAAPGDALSTDPVVTSERAPTLLEQMGGVTGIVASTIPVVVFVVANILLDLRPAVIAALVSGVAIAGWRIVRRQPLQPAVSGLFGVGIAAFLAYRSGEARAFYLPGLIYSAACGLAFLVSAAVRWPLAGVIWHGINGDGQGWRRDRRLLRAYTWATLLWALVFVARVVVQGLLYRYDAETWLGVARLAMGYPLVGVALLGTVWAVRRARRAPSPLAEPGT
ncbi:MAG: hypothetical protein QOK35_1956 [Pseudonocardiales bacterium]|nr:hypothetical protein [Pseudonocardiales bacterium]